MKDKTILLFYFLYYNLQLRIRFVTKFPILDGIHKNGRSNVPVCVGLFPF